MSVYLASSRSDSSGSSSPGFARQQGSTLYPSPWHAGGIVIHDAPRDSSSSLIKREAAVNKEEAN
jgi:hypothetical protein